MTLTGDSAEHIGGRAEVAKKIATLEGFLPKLGSILATCKRDGLIADAT